MKVLFSSNRNPHFETFTEYIEKALKENGCEVLFFENRDFSIPGRIRDKVAYLHQWDLHRINKKLSKIARDYRPDLFLEAGGWNILPDTVDALRKMKVKTALWTIDAPREFESIREAAPYYDFIFTQGTEAYEIIKNLNVKNLRWLPFACDYDFHRPIELTDEEKQRYGCDVCFVGSETAYLYPERKAILESLTDFDLGIWGPGWDTLSEKSPLKNFIRGGHIRPEEWIKIYSASKIAICIHYHDPQGKIPCYQASPRVFEALACGAFLVCDRQRDVLSLFNPGEDLVIFNNIKELREIITYYLLHPDEARSIAERGRKKVLKNHTYRHRIKEILAQVARD